MPDTDLFYLLDSPVALDLFSRLVTADGLTPYSALTEAMIPAASAHASLSDLQEALAAVALVAHHTGDLPLEYPPAQEAARLLDFEVDEPLCALAHITLQRAISPTSPLASYWSERDALPDFLVTLHEVRERLGGGPPALAVESHTEAHS